MQPNAGAGRGEPEHEVREVELLLQIDVRPAHDRQIVAEQESADRRHEGDQEGVPLALQPMFAGPQQGGPGVLALAGCFVHACL